MQSQTETPSRMTQDVYLKRLIDSVHREAESAFAMHRVSVQRLGRLTLLEYADPDRPQLYNVKLIFDQKDATLYLDGDIGTAAFRFWDSHNTIWSVISYAKNWGYFMDKALGQNAGHTFDRDFGELQLADDFRDTIDDLKNDHEYDEIENITNAYHEILDEYNDGGTFDNFAMRYNDEVDPIESPRPIGERATTQSFLWREALNRIPTAITTYIPGD